MQERVTVRLLEANEELWGKAELEMDVNATYSFERRRRRPFSSLEMSDASIAAIFDARGGDAGGAGGESSDGRGRRHGAAGRAPEESGEAYGTLRRMRSFEDFAVQTHLAVVTTPWKLSRARAVSGERLHRSPRQSGSSRERKAPDGDARGGGEWRGVGSGGSASPPSAALQLAPRPRMTRSDSLGLVATFSRVPNLPSGEFDDGYRYRRTPHSPSSADAVRRRSGSGSDRAAGVGAFYDSPLLLAHFDSGSRVDGGSEAAPPSARARRPAPTLAPLQRWDASAMPLLLMLPTTSLCDLVDALSYYGSAAGDSDDFFNETFEAEDDHVSEVFFYVPLHFILRDHAHSLTRSPSHL